MKWYHLNSFRREFSRRFNIKMREYLRDKINEPRTNSKNKNISGLYRRINEFKSGCQPRSNVVEDKNSGLLAAPQ
jgi:hypothetical protein